MTSGHSRFIQPGEHPLRAFVSSVMRPELEWARETTVNALNENPTLVPWAFEFTPLSSDAADNTYLEKVRDADIVIWLVSDETTAPVRNEIAEALAASRRLWVIRLRVSERDSETRALLAAVGERAKYGDAATQDELRELLALTFGDEVVRALRDRPSPTRLSLLERLARASRGRMVNRWRAAGLSKAEALAFANDPSIGEPQDELLPTADEPVRIVVADVGAGKSVFAERAFQASILVARSRASAPVPIFIHARDAREGLETAILVRSQGLGDARLDGAFVVVDGLDEVPRDQSARLVEDARVLAETTPDTRIVVTSRPIPSLFTPAVSEVSWLPPLSDEEARDLVARVAGYEITIGATGGWPDSLADAVRRPLFAILLGLNRRRDVGAPPTTGALLATLVESALDPQTQAEATPLLRKLAGAVTDAAGPVEMREVRDHLTGTEATWARLVVIDGKHVDFGLPILTQWFAAQSLLVGETKLSDLVRDPARLDRWRYALAISLSTGPRRFIDETMTTLVRDDPGFAAELVGESLARSDDEPRPDSDPLIAGEQLHTALSSWADGIAPLDRLLLPHADDGSLLPVAVSAEPGWLTTGWYLGSETVGDIVQLPSDLHVFGPGDPNWHVRRGGKWSNEAGWAWRWALEILSADLKQLVGGRALLVADDLLIDEALWILALEIAGRGGTMSYDPVPLSQVEAALSDLDPELPTRLRDRLVSTDHLIDRLRRRREAGDLEIRSPWPEPDNDVQGQGASWIWDPFTPEQQRRRVEAVYAAVLCCYSRLVEHWFPALRSRMLTATTLPAVFVGTLKASSPGAPVGMSAIDADQWATMVWYLEPLAITETSTARVTLEESDAQDPGGSEKWRDEMKARQAWLVELRPKAAAWIQTVETHSALDVFQQAPVAEILFSWLESDLKRIKWT
jgi:hypothetical protein